MEAIAAAVWATAEPIPPMRAPGHWWVKNAILIAIFIGHRPLLPIVPDMILADQAISRAGDGETSLNALKRRVWDEPNGALISAEGFRLRITDGPNAYMQIK